MASSLTRLALSRHSVTASVFVGCDAFLTALPTLPTFASLATSLALEASEASETKASKIRPCEGGAARLRPCFGTTPPLRGSLDPQHVPQATSSLTVIVLGNILRIVLTVACGALLGGAAGWLIPRRTELKIRGSPLHTARG